MEWQKENQDLVKEHTKPILSNGFPLQNWANEIVYLNRFSFKF